MKTKNTIDIEQQQEEALMNEELSFFSVVSNFVDYVELYSFETMLEQVVLELHRRKDLEH